jgi:hypothetical protein
VAVDARTARITRLSAGGNVGTNARSRGTTPAMSTEAHPCGFLPVHAVDKHVHTGIGSTLARRVVVHNPQPLLPLLSFQNTYVVRKVDL